MAPGPESQVVVARMRSSAVRSWRRCSVSGSPAGLCHRVPALSQLLAASQQATRGWARWLSVELAGDRPGGSLGLFGSVDRISHLGN